MIAATDAQSNADAMRRVTKLRTHKPSIHGTDGEDVLEWVREPNLTTGYRFMLEALGVENDPLQPYLQLNMETCTTPRPGGKPVDSSLHDAAVLAPWDRVLVSIRPPPGARPDSGARARPVVAPDGAAARP
jgi:hypothetical protein